MYLWSNCNLALFWEIKNSHFSLGKHFMCYSTTKVERNLNTWIHTTWMLYALFSSEKSEDILADSKDSTVQVTTMHSQWRVRSASSASSFSSFSGKCRLAHQKRPSTPSTTNTVISPNQNGSCSMRWDSGLYGMCSIRRSHLAPGIRVWGYTSHSEFVVCLGLLQHINKPE